MPWTETTPMEEIIRFVILARSGRFAVTGNRLVPLQGNYLRDLFELKRTAWLDDAYDQWSVLAGSG
jgi:hypothetical protein